MNTQAQGTTLEEYLSELTLLSEGAAEVIALLMDTLVGKRESSILYLLWKTTLQLHDMAAAAWDLTGQICAVAGQRCKVEERT